VAVLPPVYFLLPTAALFRQDLGTALRLGLSRNLCISTKKCARLLSIIAQLVHFRVKGVFLAGHFVVVAFVFMHIPGGCFIFNISKGQLPVSDLEKHIRKPPQLAQAGIFPSSYEQGIFILGSHHRHKSGVSVLLPVCLLPFQVRGLSRQPAGDWPQESVYIQS
jgi:hypothetical protein